MNITNEKVTYRSGTSFARGTTIDAYLSDEDCKALYEHWQADWPEPLQFQGGITAITAEMILDVVGSLAGARAFNRVLGKHRATRILEAARRNTEG